MESPTSGSPGGNRGWALGECAWRTVARAHRGVRVTVASGAAEIVGSGAGQRDCSLRPHIANPPLVPGLVCRFRGHRRDVVARIAESVCHPERARLRRARRSRDSPPPPRRHSPKPRSVRARSRRCRCRPRDAIRSNVTRPSSSVVSKSYSLRTGSASGRCPRIVQSSWWWSLVPSTTTGSGSVATRPFPFAEPRTGPSFGASPQPKRFGRDWGFASRSLSGYFPRHHRPACAPGPSGPTRDGHRRAAIPRST